MESQKPEAKLSVKELSIIPIFAAITAVLSQIAIPLPFTPMPISFGLVAVYISGILLKPKHAALSQICYLALGAVGVPVFGNFRGGIAALFGPTGGYLLVYPIMAWVVAMGLNSQFSLQAERTQGKGIVLLKSAIAMCIAHIILYLSGTTWLSVTTGTTFLESLLLAVVPFILLDTIKILLCVFCVVPVRFRLMAANVLMLDRKQRAV